MASANDTSDGRPHSIPSVSNALNSPEPVSLFKIPPELRNRIYEYALHLEDGICIVSKTAGIPEPALLMTCKIIRREAIAVFYSENFFRVIIESFSPSTAMLIARKEATLSKRYNCTIQDAGAQHEGPRSWRNMVSFLRFLHEHGEKTASTAISPLASSPYSQDLEDTDKESAALEALLTMASHMSDKPWETVEKIVTLLRYSIVHFSPDWATD